MSEGAWDAMLRWEAETGKVIASVPGIAPAPSAEREPISSTAGLAALRAGARRAGVLYANRENNPRECCHPLSCLRCQATGEPCGAHHVGDRGHEKCRGTDRENGSAD